MVAAGLLDWAAGFVLDGVVVEEDVADAFAGEDFFSEVIDISVGSDDGDGGCFCGLVGGLSELFEGVESGLGVTDRREGDVGLYFVIDGVCESGEEDNFAG